jgi:ComF family protein
LADLFVQYLPLEEERPDILIPVPSHPRRMWERGYNPALLIARRLGKALNIPVDDKAIKRIRHTPPQRLQTKRERQQNLKDAFEVVKLSPHLRVALVDDVVTTGETLRALAQVVGPGVKSVVCWAIAESAFFTG